MENITCPDCTWKLKNEALEAKCVGLETSVTELERRIADLISDFQKKEELFQKKEELLNQKIALLTEQNEALTQEVQQLKKQLYGKKSERKGKAPKIDRSHKSDEDKKPKGRQPLPENLRRETITHDISEEEKICPHCGTNLKDFPPVISEQLAYQEPELYVKKHVRKQYACPKCHQTIKTADLPNQPIDKGLPDASLLAEVVISKYADSLPLYRQMKRLERQGYKLSEATLSGWVQHVGEMLKPLGEELRKEICEGRKVNADETPLPVLAPNKTHQGYLWAYIGEKAVVYQYTPTRAHKNAVDFLEDFEGHVQADAYGAYDAVCDGEQRIKVGCWAHCRRKFNDILSSQPDHRIATEAIQRIGKLYQIEEDLRNATEAERLTERQARAGPLLQDLHHWLTEQNVLPKSPIGLAIQYALNQWESLVEYLKVGFIGLDNNVAERAMRSVVLGRKNYLFAGSDRAAENSAVIYSLIGTCKMYHLNISTYLRDVIERLPSTLNSEILTLLPWNWKPRATGSSSNKSESAA